MRRPQLCCEKHHEDGQRCPSQSSGTLSRLRRFLALSLGRRVPEPSQAAPGLKSSAVLPASTFPHLLSNIREEAENVVGRPLEEVMMEPGQGDPYGVPAFVHALCCYMLTHEVDYDSLMADDWCAEEIRSALLDDLPAGRNNIDLTEEGSREATFCAGLLRLFLQELPHPLIPRELVSSLMVIYKEASERASDAGDVLHLRESTASQIRRLLFNRLPCPNLRLLQYLIAFIHQLRTANHNTCPVSVHDLSRILGRVLTRSDHEGFNLRSSGYRLAEMLLVNYITIFIDPNNAADEVEYNSDSVSSSCDSRSENTDADLIITPDEDEDTLGVNNDDDDDDDDDEDDDDSTTTTTTTSDTDELRSPLMISLRSSLSGGRPSSPCRSRFLPRLSSLWTPKRLGGHGGPSRSLFDSTSPVTHDPRAPEAPFKILTSGDRSKGGGAASQKCSSGTVDKLSRPSSSGLIEGPARRPQSSASSSGVLPRRKRKGHAEGGAGEHDPKALRSNAEIQDGEGYHYKISPYGKDYLPSITDLLKSPDESWRDEGISSYSNEKEPYTQSAESSCLSEGEETESDCDRDADGSDTEGAFGSPCPHEERRSSERFFPRSHKAPSGGRRPRKKTRRKHVKDVVARVQSSEEEERETGSCFASLLSREEEPATFDPTPPDVESSQPFKDLLAFNEPVMSDRVSWGLKKDMSHSDKFHRTARHYSSRYGDENSDKKSNWFRGEEVAPDSSRASKSFPAPQTESPERHPAGQVAVKILMKNMNSIKKKIKKFEEEFETAFGYRPSHSEKMKHKDIKKYMSELNKVRKQIKQKKEDVAGMFSIFRCQEATTPKMAEPSSSGTGYTLREVEERLREKRLTAKRPTDLNSMTVDQIQDEKTALQRALLYYESLHGRPTTREDKDLARPLYDRYREVKRSITRSSSRTKENLVELAPILEHVVMDFTLASPQHRGSLQEEADIQAQEEVDATLNQDPHPDAVPGLPEDKESPRADINLGDLHALPTHELKERKREAKEEKKTLRGALRDFEEKFERDNCRKVQKEDRGPMTEIYTDYKHVKAKLRLLEALLSKHEALKA